MENENEQEYGTNWAFFLFLILMVTAFIGIEAVIFYG